MWPEADVAGKCCESKMADHNKMTKELYKKRNEIQSLPEEVRGKQNCIRIYCHGTFEKIFMGDSLSSEQKQYMRILQSLGKSQHCPQSESTPEIINDYPTTLPLLPKTKNL